MPFNCDLCGSSFPTIKKYNNHCQTKKHQRKLEESNIHRCSCGKTYIQRSNLYRHKKSCPVACAEMLAETEGGRTMFGGPTIINGNFIHNTYVENEYNAEINETTIINPTFNFNFYLNEQCKDAVTIEDFCSSLIQRLNSIPEPNIKLNFIDNLSAFDQMLGNLQSMKAVQRPIQSFQGEIVEKSRDDWKALTLDKLNMHVNGITNKVNWDLYNQIPPPATQGEQLRNMLALKVATEVKPPLKEKELEELQKTTKVEGDS